MPTRLKAKKPPAYRVTIHFHDTDRVGAYWFENYNKATAQATGLIEVYRNDDTLQKVQVEEFVPASSHRIADYHPVTIMFPPRKKK